MREQEQQRTPTFHLGEEHAACRKMPISSGLDHEAKKKRPRRWAYEDPDVQIPKFPKISHELIHPLLHLADSRRFAARVFSELVKLEHVPVR